MDGWMDGRTDGRTDGWMDGIKYRVSFEWFAIFASMFVSVITVPCGGEWNFFFFADMFGTSLGLAYVHIYLYQGTFSGLELPECVTRYLKR
jgi:hypothetical protein